MKLVILSFFDNFGGAENFVQKLVRELNIKNIIIISLTNFDKRFKKQKNIKYLSLNLSKRTNFFSRIYFIFIAVIKIRKILKKYNPSTFISLKNRVNVLSSIAIYNFKNLNTIGCERTVAIEEKNFFWKLLRKFFYRNFDIIVTQDKYNSNWIKDNCYNIKKIVTIPNFLNFYEDRKKKDNNLPKKFFKKKLLISIGRLTHTKQFSVLIKIFAKISLKNKDWILVILGDGPEKKNLRKQIIKLKLQNKIFLIGWVSNTKKWIQKSQAFAFTSKLEGFPNALQQAVFLRLPTISFDCKTGPSQLIIDNKSGYLIKNNNEVEYEKKLNLLLKNKDLRIKFSKNTEIIKNRLNKKDIVRKWNKLIR